MLAIPVFALPWVGAPGPDPGAAAETAPTAAAEVAAATAAAAAAKATPGAGVVVGLAERPVAAMLRAVTSVE